MQSGRSSQRLQKKRLEVAGRSAISPSAEYDSLRSEITMRIGKQQDITSFALIALAAFVTYLSGLDGASESSMQRAILIAAPIASLALSGFALMALDHEMNIAHATRYVYEQLPQRLLGEVEPGWNSYRAKWQQHSSGIARMGSVLAAAKYYTTIVPSIGLTAVSWYWLLTRQPSDPKSWLPCAISTLFIAVVLISSAYTSKLWLHMKYSDEGL